MPKALEFGTEQAAAKWWRRRPPTGVAGAVFWLALWFGLLWLLRQVPGVGNTLLSAMQVLVGVALAGLAVPLAWRIVNRHFLWSLRNKLILTYLLIGLAPVVLFVTLAMVSAYIAAGQFSIHLADTRIRQQLDEMGTDNSAHASRLANILRESPPPGHVLHGQPDSSQAPGQAAAGQLATDTAAEQAAASAATLIGEVAPSPLLARLHRHNSIYLNGVPLFASRTPAQPSGNAALPVAAQEGLSSQTGVPLGLPTWAADLHGNQFRGLVLDDQSLFLVAIDQRHTDGKGLLTVVTSLPVDSALMDVVAERLGRVGLSGLMTDAPATTSAAATGNGAQRAGRRRSLGNDLQRTSVYGGVEPPAVNFCDLGVSFLSTMDITDWDTGQPDNVPIRVRSRPSLLYRQLFGSSLGGIVTNTYRNGLIALCILFALIESIALWMALRLSGTITTSVEELYAATQRVDRGDFVHRIAAAPTGQQDQLGELSRSFNRMTGSLERLMVEQQEKERLQSELSIAQEVQANLFPRNVRDLPTLELHGICRPARSVSGDYYDFLVFHHPDNPDGTPGRESGVGIALGDISGKGISAALLMATLHSAVRAYRLASEDLVYSESAAAALMVSRDGLAGDGGKLFESPGRILSLLNRHLYRSTQPSKYATLFLAHYDAETAQLTYSNAGHLPPLLLSLDGKVRRLDCGGTVVGLMDGMRYQEDRVPMHRGDVLVAYSDGITEPENDFGEFGEERLLEVVARYRDQPLHVISAQVMLALDAWIGAEEQPDDITLVLARQL
jgi:sigma-B regulation protein RsbU (phosphoserine phosphatase)